MIGNDICFVFFKSTNESAFEEELISFYLFINDIVFIQNLNSTEYT